MRIRESSLATALALARTGICAYRAWHQSLVNDEALTYNRFVGGPWSNLWSAYDANNHVLFSFLAKISIRLFGLSEFTLRLPSLLAGFFLMLGIFRVLETCQSRFLRWTAYIALALHPLLLDLSVAARGYSLGLALLVWALYHASKGRELLTGILLGLAISANLTMIFPAAALMGANFLIVRTSRLRSAFAMMLPAIALAAAICYLPLRTAKKADFYVGEPGIRLSVLSLTSSSLHINRFTPQRGTGLFGTDEAARLIADWVVPAVIGMWTFTVFRACRKKILKPPHLIVPLTLGFSCLAQIAAHLLANVNYPVDRTGLFLVVFAGLTWPILANLTDLTPLRIVNLAIALALIVQYATQFQLHYFQIWWFNMADKEIAQRLRQELVGRPAQSITLATTGSDYATLEFYRNYYVIDTLKPIVPRQWQNFDGDNYYVLTRSDTFRQQAAQLKPLFQDPLSGSMLAIRDPAVRPSRRIGPFTPGRYDDLDESIEYIGHWTHDQQFEEASEHSLTYSARTGDTVRIPIIGTGVVYIFTKAWNRGIARVIVDGKEQTSIDEYSKDIEWQSSKAIRGLEGGPHLLEILVSGEKNPKSADTFVDLDRFEVLP